jgi:hypothetical protein
VSDTHIDFAGIERFQEKLRERLGQKFAMPGDTIATTRKAFDPLQTYKQQLPTLMTCNTGEKGQHPDG